MKKESLVFFSGKDNRPSSPGKGFILEVGQGCLILLLLIARLIMTVDKIYGLSYVVWFVFSNVRIRYRRRVGSYFEKQAKVSYWK